VIVARNLLVLLSAKHSSTEHRLTPKAFYAAGPTMIAKVAGFLRSLHEHGLLRIDNLELAAERLIASWLGFCQLQQSLALQILPSRRRSRNVSDLRRRG